MRRLEELPKWLIIFLLVVGILSRFVFLDKFPSGINHDELEYILSARSYWTIGADISGEKFPLSIVKTKTDGIISFLPAVILSPIYDTFKLTQVTARLPYVLINLITAVGLFLLTRKLFQKEKVAVWATIIFLFSPWSYFFSRTATDTPLALMFLVFGMWLFQMKDKKWQWTSLLFFMSSFLSYHGAKTIVPLVVLAMSWYKGNLRQNVGYLVIMVVLVGGYFGMSKLTPESIASSRNGDIVFLDKKLISDEVNRLRSLTVSNPLTYLLINKTTVSVELFLRKYMAVFSPEVLLINGDGRATYRFGEWGLWGKVEMIFLIIGTATVGLKKRKEAYLLLGLGLVAPIASGLSTVGTSVINRSFLLLPIFCIVSGYGVNEFLKRKSLRWWNVIGALLTISFGSFLFFYNFRWIKLNQESNFQSERVVSNYIIRNEKTNKIVAVVSEPRGQYLNYLFYSNQEVKLPILVGEESYGGGNTLFINRCPKYDPDTIYIYDNDHRRCFVENINELSIKEEEYWGAVRYISGDKICDKGKLRQWAPIREMGDYSIEKLSDNQFCEKWIFKK